MDFFPGVRVNEQKERIIINQLKKKFVDYDLLSTRILFWNSFKFKPQKYTLEQAKQLKQPHLVKNLYFYNERERRVYKVESYTAICDYIEKLEPWENVDALVFKEDMSWVIAFTHEDIVLSIGL
ncbi:hypothetical protein [Paludifilum halophilum]|uniref:Uncharacterized protein n=1 Tax=Paludifilum halophilum TaxID=1642702 RepID=A0A235B2R2_9BACL|nr:hypothetical protein [Paludifilum halophilum]OYD06596.1 hypothetical protein CHM34_16015 [Paludifilum halophilum]